MNNENMLNDSQDDIRYVVRVNGQEVSPRYTTPSAAEAMLIHLSEAHRSIAEVVTVTNDGQQLLLG